MEAKKIEKNVCLKIKQLEKISGKYLKKIDKNDLEATRHFWKSNYVLIVFYLLVIENLLRAEEFSFDNDGILLDKIINEKLLDSYFELVKCENSLQFKFANAPKIKYNFKLNSKLNHSITSSIVISNIFLKNVQENIKDLSFTKELINNLKMIFEKYSIYYIVNKNAPQFEVKIKDNLNNELNYKIDYTKELCILINEIHLELRKIFPNQTNDLSNYINHYSKSLCVIK